MNKNQRMTLLDARVLVAKMVIKSGIPGLKGRRWNLYPKYAFKQVMAEAKGSSWGIQYFSFEQAWGANASLEVEFKNDHTMVGGKKHPCSKPHVSINWSSTGRGIAEARVAIVLYSALVDLGCLIDVHVSGFDIESLDEACKREHKEDQAKQEAKFQIERDALKNGHLLDPDDPQGVVLSLFRDLKDAQCEGTTGKGEQCKSKGKVGVWSKEQQRFIFACHRHLLQVQSDVLAP